MTTISPDDVAKLYAGKKMSPAAQAAYDESHQDPEDFLKRRRVPKKKRDGGDTSPRKV